MANFQITLPYFHIDIENTFKEVFESKLNTDIVFKIERNVKENDIVYIQLIYHLFISDEYFYSDSVSEVISDLTEIVNDAIEFALDIHYKRIKTFLSADEISNTDYKLFLSDDVEIKIITPPIAKKVSFIEKFLDFIIKVF